MPLAWTLPNGFRDLTNSAGDSTLTCTRPNQTFRVLIEGVARLSKLILRRLNRRSGDLAIIDLELPEVADIAIEVRDDTSAGALLLPSGIFPDQQFLSDGISPSARFRFVYTGAAWRYVDSQIPA